MGGYEASKKAYWFAPSHNYVSSADGIIFDPVDLSSGGPFHFSFDLAYCYRGTEDTLRVQMSEYCGASWKEVYSKVGKQFSSCQTQTSSWFKPKAEHWSTEVIDLSEHSLGSSVLVKWELATAKKSLITDLFVDNFNIGNVTGIGEFSDQ